MTMQDDTMPDAPAAPVHLAPRFHPARPFYWSVRRELWENRSIYIGPLVAACIMLLGFTIGTIHLASHMRALLAGDPALLLHEIAKPYNIASVMVFATAIIVAIVYYLGALHNERRDRSILFWKSLPVSDTTTVLAKAAIPLVILPLVACVVTIATQLVILLLSTVVLLAYGVSVAALWTQLPLLRMDLILAYSLVVVALWYAPVYAWLLLVSAWARRVPFLWAVLPPLGLCVIEFVSVGSSHLFKLLAHRLTGGFAAGFAKGALNSDSLLPQVDVARLLGSAGLWWGLAIAAGLLAGTVYLRRGREAL